MSEMDFDLDHAIAVLERIPATLSELLEGLPPGWVEGDEGPETFSPYEVVGHLIHGELTDWMPRAKIILEEGEARPFEPYDRFAQREASRGKTLIQLLGEFAELRARNLEKLREMGLTAADFGRRGVHPDLGPVTLGQLLASWVIHDLGHIGQIARVMAKQWTAAAGPWRKHLPVLDDRR